MIPRDVAFKHNLHKSMITRWKVKENEIYEKNGESKKAHFFRKCRRNDKHKVTKLCSVDCMTSFVKQEKRAYK